MTCRGITHVCEQSSRIARLRLCRGITHVRERSNRQTVVSGLCRGTTRVTKDTPDTALNHGRQAAGKCLSDIGVLCAAAYSESCKCLSDMGVLYAAASSYVQLLTWV